MKGKLQVFGVIYIKIKMMKKKIYREVQRDVRRRFGNDLYERK